MVEEMTVLYLTGKCYDQNLAAAFVLGDLANSTKCTIISSTNISFFNLFQMQFVVVFFFAKLFAEELDRKITVSHAMIWTKIFAASN